MEKINENKFKFNKISKFEMKQLFGGTTLICCYPTDAVSGGDTAHETTTDTGVLMNSYWTKGNGLPQC